ncbi:MAG TPA: UDP-3-O-(3-hydroxymyristoyl)glucosamine N-acyltransferase [Pyrinomonadaceae bacterium]|nr:UDP-3-O-(3-hydroxymyristoyl)glucosamine N-acyltransferase [Pyrinomonadaceae bacterium]
MADFSKETIYIVGMKTREIADLLAGELLGSGDVEVTSVASVESAGEGQIAFVQDTARDISSSAGCLIVPEDFEQCLSTPLIRTPDPKLAFALIARKLRPYEQRYFGDAPSCIAESAQVRTIEIGAFVSIGDRSDVREGCQIADGVKIGRNVLIKKHTVIHPNVIIYDNVEIGDSCVIHAGAVIGADGFGYVRDEAGEYHQFPQIGTVLIEDNVEIGANTCIDRGALGETRIGEGTKIDNLVQIGHNVQIGKRVIIAAQTGISGSTVIEDDCIIGGQVGMGDHARVLSGAVIGSQAGVLPGKIVRPGVWWGTPVQRLEDYKRQNAHVKGLERLKAEVKRLKERLASGDTE